jgi:dienelactone hydrolase
MLRLDATLLADPFPSGTDATALLAWRSRAVDRVRALLGDRPPRVPPDVETTQRVDCGAYTRERIVFDAEPTMSVPAYLLVPNDRTRPGPAVLALHGHGPGKHAICNVDPDDGEHEGGRYAHDLASVGYVVLAPDARCFGERSDWNPPDHYACDTNLVSAVLFGASPLAQNLWDLSAALDVLAGHPLVDDARVGVAGFSFGGTLALFLAAVDERVRVAVVSGYVSSLRAAHRVPWNLCGSQIAPGMLGALEHVDVAASLVARCPLLVETGAEDLIFPLDDARATVAALHELCDALGAARDTVVHHVFEGEHRYDGAAVPAFLDRFLPLDPTAQ